MMVTPKDIAWKAYEAACDARYAHIHADHCELCWAGQNTQCQTWAQLSAEVFRTMTNWINIGE